MENGNMVKRLIEKADFFLQNDIQVFIKDYDNNYYFADILIVGETHLLISNFEGNRKGEKSRLSWIEIKSIKEYKEKGDLE